MYCGCKMNWAAASWVAGLMQLVFNTKVNSHNHQFVCNQGNHSAVKTSNLFLHCRYENSMYQNMYQTTRDASDLHDI